MCARFAGQFHNHRTFPYPGRTKDWMFMELLGRWDLLFILARCACSCACTLAFTYPFTQG